MLIGCGIFSIAIKVELTHDFHTPLFIPGIVDGKLKVSFEVGEHGDIMTGGFSLASPMSATSIYGCLLEAVTCTAVRKAGERAWDSGDGI